MMLVQPLVAESSDEPGNVSVQHGPTPQMSFISAASRDIVLTESMLSEHSGVSTVRTSGT